MKNLLSAIISVIVFSSAGFAVDNSSDNFTIPHDFSSGETISSQKMNENFQAIQELFNKLIKFNELTVELKYVAVGGSGTILTSSDGISWTSRTSGISNSFYGVTYANSTFVAVGDSGTIITSSDGTSWT